MNKSLRTNLLEQSIQEKNGILLSSISYFSKDIKRLLDRSIKSDGLSFRQILEYEISSAPDSGKINKSIFKPRGEYSTDQLNYIQSKYEPVAALDEGGAGVVIFRDKETGKFAIAIRGSEIQENTISDIFQANLAIAGNRLPLHQTVLIANFLLRETSPAGTLVPQFSIADVPNSGFVDTVRGIIGISEQVPGPHQIFNSSTPGFSLVVTNHVPATGLAFGACYMASGHSEGGPEVTIASAVAQCMKTYTLNSPSTQLAEMQHVVDQILSKSSLPPVQLIARDQTNIDTTNVSIVSGFNGPLPGQTVQLPIPFTLNPFESHGTKVALIAAELRIWVIKNDPSITTIAQANAKLARLFPSLADAFTQPDTLDNFIPSGVGSAQAAPLATSPSSESGDLSSAYNFPDTAGAGRGNVNPPTVEPKMTVFNAASALQSYAGINFVTIQAGDTVSAIALRYGMDIAEFSAYLKSVYGPNADLNSIVAGSRLPVPQSVFERTSGGINGLDLPPEVQAGGSVETVGNSQPQGPIHPTDAGADGPLPVIPESTPMPLWGASFDAAWDAAFEPDNGPPLDSSQSAPNAITELIQRVSQASTSGASWGGFSLQPVNATSSFLVNADGDIAGEVTRLADNYTRMTDTAGNTVYIDAQGRMLDAEQYQSQKTESVASSVVAAVNALSALAQWDGKSDVARASALVAVTTQVEHLRRLVDTSVEAGGSSSTSLPYLGAGLGLLNAVEHGDMGGIAINGLALADLVTDQAASKAISAALNDAGMKTVAGDVLPYLALANSLLHAEEDPLGVVVAALQFIPGWGQALAAFITVARLLDGGDEPPMKVGHAQALWLPDGSLDYASLRDEASGYARAQSYLSQLTEGLQEALDQVAQAQGLPAQGLIPSLLPKIGYVLEPAQDNQDRVRLYWTDELGVERTLYFDDLGRPVAGRDGTPPGNQELGEAFFGLARQAGAVAPLWQVQTLQAAWVHENAIVRELNAQIEILQERLDSLMVSGEYSADGEGGSTTYTAQVSSNPEATAALEAQVRSLREQAAMEAAQADLILNQRIQALEQFAEAQPQFNDSRMSLRVDALTLGPEEAAPIAADFDGDGYFTETQWFGKAQAVLTLDLNADGRLGFEEMIDRDGLRLLDADSNQRIDERDPAFRALRLWVDANRDAIADAGEARSFSELGISAIDLRDDGLSGVRLRRVDGSTEGFTQTQLDLATGEGFQVRELAGGIGTLISTKAADGTIQDVVIGTNTREFDNDPLHRNSSDAYKKRDEKSKVNAGDERLSGDVQDAYQAAQTLTRVAEHDARGASGTAGITILGQDSTQQTQAEPSSTDLYSLVAARSNRAFEDDVPAYAPRGTVVVGDAQAASLAMPPAVEARPSSVLSGQPPQAQVESAGQLEADTTNTSAGSGDATLGGPQVLSGQSAGRQATQNLAHRPDRMRRSARTTSGTRANISATAPSAPTILNEGDARILNAASTPVSRPAAPDRITPILGATEQAQSAAQELQRAQQALIRSADAAPFGGNALGSAGLMAVGIGAAAVQWPLDTMASTAGDIELQGIVETGALPPKAQADAMPSTREGASVRLADAEYTSTPSRALSDNAAAFRPALTVSQPLAASIATEAAQPMPSFGPRLGWAPFPDTTPAFDVVTPSAAEPVPTTTLPASPVDAAAPASATGAGGTRLQSTSQLVLKDLTWEGSEDQRLLIDASAFVEPGADGASDEVTFSDISATLHGSVTLVNGKIVFVPEKNYVGEAGFDYTVVNARGQLATGSAHLQIAAVNDAPQLSDEYALIEEDRILLISGSELLANDFDVDDESSSLQITSIGETHHLSAALGRDGSIRITPDAHYHGPASFSYTVSDPHGASSTAYAHLDIASVNDAPVAVGEHTNTEEDTGLVFTPEQLLQNDQDPDIDTDADSLHISSVEDARHGRAWIDEEGNIRFLPDADYNGPAGFSYWVEDQTGARSLARVDIDVASINDAPRVLGEAASGAEDTVLWFDPADLLDNDQDAEGDSLSIVAVGGARHGTVVMTVAPDGMHRIEFIPDPNYFGPASFEYTVADSAGATSTTTAYIDLAEINDAPVAVPDERSMVEDQPHIFRAEELLANDLDADSNGLQEVHSVIDVHSSVHGQAILRNGEIMFTPDADYFGDAAFSYMAVDGRGGTSQGQVILHVAPVNDAPVLSSESIASDEDQSLVIAASALLANDADIDSDVSLLQVSAVGNAQHGDVRLQPDGSILFTPEADYAGPAGFDYTVSDAEGGSSMASVALELAPLNDAPRPIGETLLAEEDTPFLITPEMLLENDADVDSPHAALSLSAVGQSQHGQVDIQSDGSILFTPDGDYFGPASFEYTVSDDHGAISTQQVQVELQAVNDAPVLVGESASADEDHVLRFSGRQLLQNDGDIDNPHEDLRIVSVSDALHGSVELDGLGGVRFTPDLNYNGPAGFRYTVSDGSGGLSQVGLSLQLHAVNDAPSVTGELLEGQENQPLSLSASSLLANDADVDNVHAELQLSWVGNAIGGDVTLDAGTVRFTPQADRFGAASFEYLVNDGAGGSSMATAYIDLHWQNHAPQAMDDQLTQQAEDTEILIRSSALLRNDGDPDIARGAADGLRISGVSALSGLTHGNVWLDGQGDVRYSPEQDYAGPVRFAYTLEDSAGAQSTATVDLDLENVNDAPVAHPDRIIAKNQSEVLIAASSLLDNDTDPDTPYAAQGLHVTAVSEADQGSVELRPDGRIVFTPYAGGTGVGSFNYEVSDAAGATSMASAQVITRNQMPEVLGEILLLQEDQVRIIAPSELLANDSDTDNAHGDLRILAVGPASNGAVSLNDQGQIVFTPQSNYSGPAQFSYTVGDGDGAETVGTVDIAIAAVNDAPSLTGETYHLAEDQVALVDTASLLSNDSDVDGPGPLAVVGVGAASGGSVSLQGGQVVFSPYGNFNGWAGFNYVVSDGAGGLSQARADLHYQPVNDAPVATGETFSGYQDVQYSFSDAALLANDWDPDGDSLSLSSVGNAQHGSVSLSGNSVVFTPAVGYAGVASFGYTVSDSSGAQAHATATLNLVHRNFAPVTVDDSFTTYEDTPIVITDAQVLANDSDDGGRENLRAYVINPASYDSTYSPQGGSLTAVDIDHSVMFTPTANYSGMGSFWYRAQDAEGLYTLTRIYVSIMPVNDAPTAADDYVTTLRNTPVLITASQLLANDSDIDGAPGSYSVVGVDGPINGTLAVQPDGASVLFTPNAGFAGAASFGYTIQDAQSARAHGMVNVNVVPGVAPVALDMDGDGVELVAAQDSAMRVDVDGDLQPERIGWVSPDDGVLAYDADRNGRIDLPDEVSFVRFKEGARTDLEGLTTFDTDGDGKLNAGDREWQAFGVLQDRNANGHQDEGDFRSLDVVGISSISLQSTGQGTMDHGNIVYGRSELMRADGSTAQTADVAFVAELPAVSDTPMTPSTEQQALLFNQYCAGAAEPAESDLVFVPASELHSFALPEDSATFLTSMPAANSAPALAAA